MQAKTGDTCLQAKSNKEWSCLPLPREMWIYGADVGLARSARSSLFKGKDPSCSRTTLTQRREGSWVSLGLERKCRCMDPVMDPVTDAEAQGPWGLFIKEPHCNLSR